MDQEPFVRVDEGALPTDESLERADRDANLEGRTCPRCRSMVSSGERVAVLEADGEVWVHPGCVEAVS